MFDNRELAEYLNKEIEACPDFGAEELEFWIQQFKTRKWEGHTEWNEMYKINVWVSDIGDENEKKTNIIKKKNR